MGPSIKRPLPGNHLTVRYTGVTSPVQFHPTGLLVGDSSMSRTVLKEGLRAAGGYLFDGHMDRYLRKYDPIRLGRSTRDIVARSSYLEIIAGRGSPRLPQRRRCLRPARRVESADVGEGRPGTECQ
jgi:succinate dehydrogenase/fumarate reductase flavoprotein subunit